MIDLLPGRVYAYTAPCDMRRGYDRLSAMVVEELGQDLLSGDLFLFVSRNRVRAKVLAFDGTGVCLYCKRIEKGQFACLWRESRGSVLELSRSELGLFLEGSQLIGRRRLSPPPLTRSDLAISESM